tara:strand:- start:900 stop:1172 length:273 start_codon:yes stop_codon:yes gene_type:complete
MITVIEKIEEEGGFFKFTPVGFTQDQDLINEINQEYDSTLGKFLGENRTKLEIGLITISVFFDVTPSVNEARTQQENTDGLKELKSINEL